MAPRFATGPVTWGVDFADSPDNPPWTLVLDEIARSGIGALELGPLGYLPTDGAQLREALTSRGLTSVGSFVFDDMHTPAERPRVVEAARRASEVIAASGGTVLVVIDRPGPDRTPTAGRSAAAQRLSGDRLDDLYATLSAVAAVAVEHGLDPAVHPHAGGYIEFDDEIDRIVQDTTLNLCLDTGHLAYARIDPVAAIRRYAGRVTHIHLKDVSPTVLAAVDTEELGFWDAIARQIFCPLGAGVVDLAGVLGALADIGYDGHATIEQDRVPGVGSPLADLQASLDALRRAQSQI